MAVELPAALPAVPPSALGPDGAPHLGTFAGGLGVVDLRPRLGAGLRGQIGRVLRLKRWHYGCVATREVFAGFAFVDVGYATNAFAVVVDLARGGTVLSRGFMGLPLVGVSLNDAPGEGAAASFRSGATSLRLDRARGTDSFVVTLRSPGFELDAVLDAADAPPALTAILTPSAPGGDAFLTQKTNLLPALGSVKVGSRTWSLAGGLGGLDFTHGLLPRRTAWRWAFGLGHTPDGLPVGLNLTEGLSAEVPGDNGAWLGRELFPLGRAHFTFDPARPEGPWQVRTDDGALELAFTAKGLHREDRNLGWVVSHFAQVPGVFNGTLRHPSGRVVQVVDVPGCVEDQRVKW